MALQLSLIDNKLKKFAREIGASVSEDDAKGMWMPDGFEGRLLRWSKNDFNYLIQIGPTLKNDRIDKWYLTALCSSGKIPEIYFKQNTFIETRDKTKIIADIDNFLKQAYLFLASLKFDDLELNEEIIPD